MTPDDKRGIIAAFRTLHIANFEQKCCVCLKFPTRIHCAQVIEWRPSEVLLARYMYVDLVDLSQVVVLHCFQLHSAFVEALSFTCDEQYLATVSQDKSLKLWHWDRQGPEVGTLKCLTRLTFHCPIRKVCPAKDLSYILVGPESAAPLAVLTLNQTLRSKVTELTESYPTLPIWLHEQSVFEANDEENAKTRNDGSDVNSDDNDESEVCKWEVSCSEVKLYMSGTLSVSVSRQGFNSCRSIAGTFSCPSSESSSRASPRSERLAASELCLPS